MNNRRTFIRNAFLCFGIINFLPTTISSQINKDCEEEIKLLFFRLQKREIKEKASIFKKMIIQYGKSVLNLVKENTINQTEEKIKIADIPDRSLVGVMKNLWNHTELTHEFTIEKCTESYLKLRVTKCFYADEMKKLEAQDIGDAFFCSYDYGFCKGLNPGIKFTRSKTLMAGDEYCNHTYEID